MAIHPSRYSLLLKILNFPLTKIVIGFVLVWVVYGKSNGLLAEMFSSFSIPQTHKNLIASVVSSLVAILTYIILYKFYEQRNVKEFSTKNIGKHLVLGILLGVILQSLTIFVMYLKGAYTIVSINSFVSILPALTMAFSTAIFEEILLRGIVFRITEESLGSYFALAISALFFGMLHLGNPNSSVVAAIGIAIQAGLLLGAAYMLTRNLWFPIAIHFAWNFTQSGIFGASVSGYSIEKSLFTSEINGPEWLTGGSFGPEGAIQATVFCVIAMWILMLLCIKRNRIVLPFWQRKKNGGSIL